MATSIPFTRGQHAILKLFQDGKPVYIAVKSWKVSENATEVNDGVNGEDRDRLDKVTNFFSIDFEVYMEDTAFLRKYMEAQDLDDAASLPAKQTLSMQFKHRNGTRSSFVLQEGKLGPADIGMGGRADAIMVSCKARCRYLRPVTSI